jgi:adenylate cyclase
MKLNDNTVLAHELYPLRDNDVIVIANFSLTFFDVNHTDRYTISSEGSDNTNYTKLVTILPSETKYEETVTIRAEIEAEDEVSFSKIDQVTDVETLRADYEKLRMVYELSKMSVTDDVNKILSKSLDLIFEILPLDRGVVLMVDQGTGFLSTHYVKLRSGLANEKREILLSSTILNKVFYSRKCLVVSDACEDPMLGKAASVRHGQIRFVICVPLMAHGKVYGILHLDAKDKINSYSSKDINLIKAIGNQTAMVIENMNLIKEVEQKVKITEHLSRFLPPHVVEKMATRGEPIRREGREKVGTVIYADIRGFTVLSEKCTPSEVVNLLNDYFERVTEFII